MIGCGSSKLALALVPMSCNSSLFLTKGTTAERAARPTFAPSEGTWLCVSSDNFLPSHSYAPLSAGIGMGLPALSRTAELLVAGTGGVEIATGLATAAGRGAACGAGLAFGFIINAMSVSLTLAALSYLRPLMLVSKLHSDWRIFSVMTASPRPGWDNSIIAALVKISFLGFAIGGAGLVALRGWANETDGIVQSKTAKKQRARLFMR